jgi:probable phosphoglycerate mutase
MIFLARHGETIWNSQKRKQGTKDSSLTTKGTEQIKYLSNLLLKKKY